MSIVPASEEKQPQSTSPSKIEKKSLTMLMLEKTTANKDSEAIMRRINGLKRKKDSRSLQKIMKDTKEHLEESIAQQEEALST